MWYFSQDVRIYLYPMNFAAPGSNDGNHSNMHFHGPGRFKEQLRLKERIVYQIILTCSCWIYNMPDCQQNKTVRMKIQWSSVPYYRYSCKRSWNIRIKPNHCFDSFNEV